jgi:hypothetical protein
VDLVPVFQALRLKQLGACRRYFSLDQTFSGGSPFSAGWSAPV